DVLVAFSIFFFFSSRRRHTRFSRDWSSDVCSSDLEFKISLKRKSTLIIVILLPFGKGVEITTVDPIGLPVGPNAFDHPVIQPVRSEERRVGEECRSRE